MPKHNKRVRRSRTYAPESVQQVNSNIECQRQTGPSFITNRRHSIHDHTAEPWASTAIPTWSPINSIAPDAGNTRHSAVFTHEVERMDQVKSIIEHFLTHCHYQQQYRQILYLNWPDEVRTTAHPSIIVMIDPI